MELWRLLNLACWAWRVGAGRDRPVPAGLVVEVVSSGDGDVLVHVVDELDDEVSAGDGVVCGTARVGLENARLGTSSSSAVVEPVGAAP
ncbi:MAG TPA: hypothetical protein VM262_05635 [Acidimicrobiales bacterium]|nr:hypothetical protein [Acidimicrobiales bacterium]